MRILVTGGAGFIGSHLVDALVASKHRVTVVDNLSTGHKQSVAASAQLYRASVTKPAVLAQIFKKTRPEVVVHLAAQKNARHSIAAPSYDADQNIMGSLHVLQAAHNYHCRRFVFISTGGVMYGRTSQYPTPETAAAHPDTPYAIAKHTVEWYSQFYRDVYKLSTISLRLANIYGPRQDPKGEAGVVAIFLQALLTGITPTIFGNGRQTRDYLYVSDAVAAIRQAIDSRKTGIYNIGTGQETSVRTVYKLCAQLTHSQVKAKFGKPVAGDLPRSALHSAAARRDLQWQPQVSLQQGLQLTADWFKNNV